MRKSPRRPVAALPAALAAALCLASVCAQAQTVRDATTERLSARLFPRLDALGRDPGAVTALKAQPAITALLRARSERREVCGTDLTCLAQAMEWSEDEITRLAAAVPTPDADGQVTRELEGIDTIVRTYGLGELPRYPAIDGSGALDAQERHARLQAATWLAQAPRAHSLQPLDPSLDFALALLDGAGRTDAIAFAPDDEGLNAPAFARARTIDWTRYRYSALVVTGVGPEVEGQALSPYGMYHVRLAAQRFARGEAPFLILTGGHAHPRATPFAEAVEMRRALIERYGVPAEAIVIEPYARHTTTNLRNAARLLMALGAPLARDALLVCNPEQSAYVESAAFTARNAAELGYQPGTIGKRLASTELEFRPSALSARVDPRDPLDP
ncbi:YdcF family protein [Novosphingobium profundi]|uniref:YdcF family protein n=1 Tax=Novosphingobium profundi TaxID=1774954 RepID=UPI001BDB1207|nr:YdcF family protein [Novosphingobium profundi]MBT0670991.1 YdcF family protein [Novosphingobium profundi]